MEQSWRAGKAILLDRADTIADGIAVRAPFPQAVEDMIGLVDDILLVEDQDILMAMRLLQEEIGIILEPAGAASTAVVQKYPERFRGKRVATILTGGNVDPTLAF